MITYTDSLDGITRDWLQGFFVGWLNPPSPETHLRILQGSSHVWLAVDRANQNVVGFITAVSDGVLAAFIPLLEVLPAYRDRGIGTELVRRMLDTLGDLYAIDLVCEPDAQPFYQRQGMQPVIGMAVRNYDRQSGARLSENKPAHNPTLNLVLTGFMGTGKSTIAQRAAARLGRPFIDMDGEIERRAGITIAELFATQGEAAFRRMERELCMELAQQRELVIATGGGALVDPANRAAMTQSGVVICLTASLEALVERLRGVSDRPLLHTPDPATRIRELLAARADAYAALPYHVDTTELSTEATVEAVLQIWHRHST